MASAPPNSWRMWVHCSDEAGCKKNRILEKMPGMVQVQTAPTRYCTDLVTATVELVKQALGAQAAKGMPGTIEKFALVSESTLPVKPFEYVYSTLAADNLSDLCLTPAKEWRWAHVDAQMVWLVKHSQWFVLNREHATKLVKNWRQPHEWENYLGWFDIEVKGAPWATMDRQILAQRFFKHPNGGNFACTDEQAIFGKIFGAFYPAEESYVDYPDLGRIWLRGEKANTAQARCRTFVVFRDSESLGSLTQPVLKVLKNDPVGNVHIDGPSHPMYLEHLGNASLHALRDSPFLFARKFIISPASVPGYGANEMAYNVLIDKKSTPV